MGKDLGILVDSKLNVSQQHALAEKKANNILSYINRSTASKLRKVIVLLPLAFVRLHLEYDVQFGVLKYKKDHDLLKQVQQWVTKTFRGLKHLTSEERLREQGLFSLETIQLQTDLTRAYQDLSVSYQEDRVRLFLAVHSGRMRQ